jgi:alanyl-tRNA synthetase
MTYKRYLFEAALGGAAVVTAVSDGPRPYVRLNQTWFHPQGGGQKGDRGSISGKVVVSVTHDDADEINHYVEDTSGLYVGREVIVEVDAQWRSVNAKLHTGGHLIAAIAESLFPSLKAVGGHHWPGEARVEFTASEFPYLDEMKGALVAEVARAVRADSQVKVVFGDDSSRSIQIGDYAPVPCGGTHVDRTSLLSDLQVSKLKMKGSRLRVSYQI